MLIRQQEVEDLKNVQKVLYKEKEQLEKKSRDLDKKVATLNNELNELQVDLIY